MTPRARAARAWWNWSALSSDYAAYHTTRGNQVCHAIGIPLIVFAVVAWTLWPGTRVPVVALVLPVYFLWDVRLALGMAAMVTGFAALAPLVPAGTALAAFVLGWVFQLAGHRIYEGRSPAFTRNLVHLLVGPAWVLQKLAAPGYGRTEKRPVTERP